MSAGFSGFLIISKSCRNFRIKVSKHSVTQGCPPFACPFDKAHTFVARSPTNPGADVPGILLVSAESQIAIHIVQSVSVNVIHHNESEWIWDKIPCHQTVKVVGFMNAIPGEMHCVVAMFVSAVAYDLVLHNVPTLPWFETS